MSFLKKVNKYHVFLLVTILFLNQCAKVDPVTGEKVIIDPDTRKKSREFVDKQGGLFGDIGGKNKNTTFEFGTSNVLWRATLKALEFLPLSNADYAGGIIVYDWYSEKIDSKEQIKISIKFLSNELKSSSVQVIGHKKICQDNEKCFTTKLEDKFTQEIKDSIIDSARALKIADAKKEQEKN
jgi:hypothetical protein